MQKHFMLEILVFECKSKKRDEKKNVRNVERREMFRKENENHKKENILANVPMNIIWTVMRYGIENEKHKTASATETPLAPVKRVKH